MKSAVFFVLVVLGSALNASAATSTDVKECVAVKAQAMAQRYRDMRGGVCVVAKIKLAPSQVGSFFSPALARPIPAISVRGEVTMSCSGALFFPNLNFTRDISVHVTTTTRTPICFGGHEVGWML